MERTSVSSSTVQSIGFESGSSTLEVEFNNGSVYHYHGVPEGTYVSLLHADSIGTYFNQNIKGVYAFTKL